jgi:ribosomal protein S18 acetylase RimI-like enzyme
MWRKILAEAVTFGEAAVFVAEAGGSLVGFGACCRQRDETLQRRGFSGEISAIYVLRSHQRGGVGRSIMGIMAQTFFEQGRTAASLWVLRENVMARGFYERLGGAILGEQQDARPNETLVEVAYGWPDVSRLLR